MNNIITSEAKFRQWVIKYFYKHGVELSPIIDNSTQTRGIAKIFPWQKNYNDILLIMGL